MPMLTSVKYKDLYKGGYLAPPIRNMLALNGASQYAVAPRVTEIDMDDPDLEFEFEWDCYLDSASKPMDVLNHSNVNGVSGNELRVRYFTADGEYRLYLYVGGSNTILALVSGFGWHNYRVTYNKSTSLAKCWIDDVYQGQRSLSVGVYREPDANLMIGALDNVGALQDFFVGEISDLRIWTGGDRNTGVLTRDYRMDEGWRGDNNQILVNYAEVQQEWVTVDQPFDSEPYTTDSNFNIYAVATLPTAAVGSSFYVTTTVTNYFNIGDSPLGWLASNWGNSSGNTNMSGDGTMAFTAIAKINGLSLYTRGARSSGPNQCTFSNISIYGGKGSGQYIGLTAASWSEQEVNP